MSKVNEVVVVKKEEGFVSYQKVEASNYETNCGERFLSHGFLMDTLRKVMGRTLTIIDSSIVDKQQNKAMKDLIRGIFSDEMEFSAEWAFDQDKVQALIPEDVEINEVDAVTIEEALGVE